MEEQLADCQIALGVCGQYLAEALRLLRETQQELHRLSPPPPQRDDGYRAPTI